MKIEHKIRFLENEFNRWRNDPHISTQEKQLNALELIYYQLKEIKELLNHEQ